MTLAIYCFGWKGDGSWKLDSQEEGGPRYAHATNKTDGDCIVYQDVAETGWARRADYERMKQDISVGKVDEVWVRDSNWLFPFDHGEKESFEALCKSKGVKISFGTGTPDSRKGTNFQG